MGRNFEREREKRRELEKVGKEKVGRRRGVKRRGREKERGRRGEEGNGEGGEERGVKLWYIPTMEYYVVIKNYVLYIPLSEKSRL